MDVEFSYVAVMPVSYVNLVYIFASAPAAIFCFPSHCLLPQNYQHHVVAPSVFISAFFAIDHYIIPLPNKLLQHLGIT